jgi:hypothetical protein
MRWLADEGAIASCRQNNRLCRPIINVRTLVGISSDRNLQVYKRVKSKSSRKYPGVSLDQVDCTVPVLYVENEEERTERGDVPPTCPYRGTISLVYQSCVILPAEPVMNF